MGRRKKTKQVKKDVLKSVDLVEFGNAFNEHQHGLITKQEFAKRLGITQPTLNKHMDKLAEMVIYKIYSGELVYTDPKSGERIVTDDDRKREQERENGSNDK